MLLIEFLDKHINTRNPFQASKRVGDLIKKSSNQLATANKILKMFNVEPMKDRTDATLYVQNLIAQTVLLPYGEVPNMRKAMQIARENILKQKEMLRSIR
jgi:hypothetical protein